MCAYVFFSSDIPANASLALIIGGRMDLVSEGSEMKRANVISAVNPRSFDAI